MFSQSAWKLPLENLGDTPKTEVLKGMLWMEFSMGPKTDFSIYCTQRPNPCEVHPVQKYIFLIGINCTSNSKGRNRKEDIGSVFWNWQFDTFLLFKSDTEKGEKNNFMIKTREGNWKSIYLSINVESMSDTLVGIWSMLLFPLSDWMLIESPFFETRAYELISTDSL